MVLALLMFIGLLPSLVLTGAVDMFEKSYLVTVGCIKNANIVVP